jgi:competence protein ComEA
MSLALAIREADYLTRCKARRPDIVVSVSGAVLQPGVIQLPADARLVHALERCGGLTAEADLETVEMAKPLQDGEHLVIGRKRIVEATKFPSWQELSQCSQVSGPVQKEAAPRQPEPASQEEVAESSSPPFDVNTADKEELESLPGIGPVLANRILQARQDSPGGSFSSLEELRAIRGMKGKTFERLKPYLKIEGS